MIIFSEPLTLQELKASQNDFFQNMVKIVVDLERKKIAVNAELHVDLEQALLADGSSQMNLWGANIYFEGEPFIEYTSMINIRPSQDNFSMEIQDERRREEVKYLVQKLILR